MHNAIRAKKLSLCLGLGQSRLSYYYTGAALPVLKFILYTFFYLSGYMPVPDTLFTISTSQPPQRAAIWRLN